MSRGPKLYASPWSSPSPTKWYHYSLAHYYSVIKYHIIFKFLRMTPKRFKLRDDCMIKIIKWAFQQYNSPNLQVRRLSNLAALQAMWSSSSDPRNRGYFGLCIAGSVALASPFRQKRRGMQFEKKWDWNCSSSFSYQIQLKLRVPILLSSFKSRSTWFK